MFCGVMLSLSRHVSLWACLRMCGLVFSVGLLLLLKAVIVHCQL